MRAYLRLLECFAFGVTQADTVNEADPPSSPEASFGFRANGQTGWDGGRERSEFKLCSRLYRIWVSRDVTAGFADAGSLSSPCGRNLNPNPNLYPLFAVSVSGIRQSGNET